MNNPTTLKGVAGDAICTQAGVSKVQTLNTKCEVVTLTTPGYYNPMQSVRLFSPQAHFNPLAKKKGSLLLSWASTCLILPNAGTLPLYIDKTCFLPMLTCFHDVNSVVQKLANPCVTNELNPKLSKSSKLLLKYHYKLGHIGFSYLKYFLKNFKLFGALGTLASDKDTDIPVCSS